MKKSLILLLLLLTTQAARPQEKRFFDSPFGAGGGYLGGWLMPVLDGIDAKIAAFGAPALSSGMYTSGGTGFAYIGILSGLRIGGIGLGAETAEAAIKDGVRREVRYSTSLGGFTLEYSLPVSRSVGVSVGVILGGGSTELELFRGNGPTEWNTLWSGVSDTALSTKNFSRTLSRSFFVVTPTLNIEVPLTRIVALRFGAAYNLALGGKWRNENDDEVLGVPSEVSANALSLQAGVLFGFFAY